MDQNLLVAAIEDQLDALSALISTTIGLALLAAWAGLQGSPKVTLFSLAVKRQHAFYLLGASFIMVNVTATIYFLRLADILTLVDDRHLKEALTVLRTNAWPYSPFAYFGPSMSSQLHSGFGFGLLIIIWWIGYTTLSLLIDFRTKRIAELAVLGGFFIVGLLSMGAIQHVFSIVSSRMRAIPFMFLSTGETNFFIRTAFTFAGIAIGGLIFCLAYRHRAKRTPGALQAEPELSRES